MKVLFSTTSKPTTMRYIPKETNVIRFDVNYELLKSLGNNVQGVLVAIPMIEDVKVSEINGQLKVGMTWKFNIEKEGEEVVGYLAEDIVCLTDFLDKDSDISVLQMFVANSFLATQKIVRDKLPMLSDLTLTHDEARFQAFGLMIQVLDKKVYK